MTEWELLQEHLLLAWPLFIFLFVFTFYLYPEDYMCIYMHYLFWLVVLSPYLFWLYSFWSLSCLPVLHVYLLAGSLAHCSMPLPLYQYPPYYILSPIPHYWPMTLSPYILTTFSVGDSVPCYPYHSLGLWLNLPLTLTLPLVSDSFLAYINPTYHGCIL